MTQRNLTMIRDLLLGSLAVAVLLAVGSGVALAAEVKLLCAHDQPLTGYKEPQWQYFKREVGKRSQGRIEVQVVGQGQMGDSPQLIDNMRIGTVDCSGISGASAGPFIPPYSVTAVPYLVESLEHRALLTDVNRPFFKEVAKLAMKYLNFHAMGTNTSSSRSIYNSVKPINHPDDLDGLKLRTMQSKVQVQSWKALGAAATALAFAEVYAGLQAGVIDGAENSPMFLWSMKHFEAIKYYSLTNHLMNTGILVLTDKAYQRIPEDLRDMVIQVGGEAGDVAKKYDLEVDADFMKKIRDAGVIVNEVDTAPFVARVRPLHDQFAEELGPEAVKLVQIIRDEAKNVK